MWASFLLVLYATITLAFIGRVLIRPRLDPSVRLAWIMVIEAVPLVGIAAYLLFGEVRMNHAEVQRMADVRDRLTGLRSQTPSLLAEPPNFARPVAAANEAVGGMPVLGGNRVALLEESDDAIDVLVSAIDRAQDHVHILFYIWLPDLSGRKVADAVARAARRGVACRVIVDALGSRGLVRSEAWREMSEAGAECVTAFPWGLPFVSIPQDITLDILHTARDLLVPGGFFRAFSYLHAWPTPGAFRLRKWMDEIFDSFELNGPIALNVPPAFVLSGRA